MKLAGQVVGGLGRVGKFLGDKAYDSRAVRTQVEDMGAEVVIPYRRTAKRPGPCDMEAHKARHLVENAFADLKQFRGVATRYCKLALTFGELFALCCVVVNTRTTRRGPSPHI